MSQRVSKHVLASFQMHAIYSDRSDSQSSASANFSAFSDPMDNISEIETAIGQHKGALSTYRRIT